MPAVLILLKHYDAVTATMPSGSVMLFDSALWHGGGANISGERRFAFSCAYCWGWMRQQENLQLGIPQDTAKRFPRRLQELCGYSVYKGQFGHIDNHDPIELLGRERGKRMVWEATDARKARMAEAKPWRGKGNWTRPFTSKSRLTAPQETNWQRLVHSREPLRSTTRPGRWCLIQPTIGKLPLGFSPQ